MIMKRAPVKLVVLIPAVWFSGPQPLVVVVAVVARFVTVHGFMVAGRGMDVPITKERSQGFVKFPERDIGVLIRRPTDCVTAPNSRV
jgi:hypothetical protein